MMKNQLGEYIKLKRSSRALSTGAVAEATGVSEATVKAWEDGHSMPSPAQLEKLCAVFDCRLTQLLFGQDGADADAMLMQLMKRLYSLRALLVAAAGALLIFSPLARSTRRPRAWGCSSRGFSPAYTSAAPSSACSCFFTGFPSFSAAGAERARSRDLVLLFHTRYDRICMRADSFSHPSV